MKMWLSKSESATSAIRAAYTVRVVLERTRTMIGFLALFGATLAGLGGMGPWVIVVAAVSLAAASRADFDALYIQAESAGLTSEKAATSVRSVAHAVVAATGAFSGGLILRLIA